MWIALFQTIDNYCEKLYFYFLPPFYHPEHVSLGTTEYSNFYLVIISIKFILSYFQNMKAADTKGSDTCLRQV